MKFLNGIGWFLLLVVRGALLWVLVPFAFLAWLLIHWWWMAVASIVLCLVSLAVWLWPSRRLAQRAGAPL